MHGIFEMNVTTLVLLNYKSTQCAPRVLGMVTRASHKKPPKKQNSQITMLAYYLQTSW